MRHANYEVHSSDESHQLLSESFDRRTLLDMEAALDRATRELPWGQNNHDVRTFIAGKIIECVVSGASSEGAIASAAFGAMRKLAEVAAQSPDNAIDRAPRTGAVVKDMIRA